MNLQPLFDLKERLEHTAVAGTGLLDEDFRLKRARVVHHRVALHHHLHARGRYRGFAQPLLRQLRDGRQLDLIQNHGHFLFIDRNPFQHRVIMGMRHPHQKRPIPLRRKFLRHRS